MIRNLLFSVGVFLVPCVAFEHDLQKEDLKMYYIPFEASTYGGITTDTIGGAALCIFHPKMTDDELKELSTFISAAEKNSFPENLRFRSFLEIRPKDIRLKIEGASNGIYFIETDGNVIKNGKDIGSISKRDLNKMDSFLYGLAFKSHCKSKLLRIFK